MKYKKRDPIIHTPTTQEIFHCLSEAKEWCQILSKFSVDKSYHDFLNWIIAREFFKLENKRITVVRLAKEFNKPSVKIKLWITQIYEDLFELNESSPQLFQKDGIKVSMYFKNNDNFTGFNISVQCIPREGERLSCYFVKAKMGTDMFYVNRVQHNFGLEHSVEIWTMGGFLNKYREFTLDRAEFQGRIGWYDLHNQHPFEIDDYLRKIYRD